LPAWLPSLCTVGGRTKALQLTLLDSVCGLVELTDGEGGGGGGDADSMPSRGDAIGAMVFGIECDTESSEWVDGSASGDGDRPREDMVFSRGMPITAGDERVSAAAAAAGWGGSAPLEAHTHGCWPQTHGVAARMAASWVSNDVAGELMGEEPDDVSDAGDAGESKSNADGGGQRRSRASVSYDSGSSDGTRKNDACASGELASLSVPVDDGEDDGGGATDDVSRRPRMVLLRSIASEVPAALASMALLVSSGKVLGEDDEDDEEAAAAVMACLRWMTMLNLSNSARIVSCSVGS